MTPNHLLDIWGPIMFPIRVPMGKPLITSPIKAPRIRAVDISPMKIGKQVKNIPIDVPIAMTQKMGFVDSDGSTMYFVSGQKKEKQKNRIRRRRRRKKSFTRKNSKDVKPRGRGGTYNAYPTDHQWKSRED